MGGDTPVYNAKNILEFPSDFSFISYLLNLNYKKSAKCNHTFWWDKFVSILSKYWQVSKYTSLLSKSNFLKKGKNKSKFWMVNLCNGGTKDFVELREIIYLKISTRFFHIKQGKLFEINLKHCSKTCSHDHLCKTTTHLRWPMGSPPKANSCTIVTV